MFLRLADARFLACLVLIRNTNLAKFTTLATVAIIFIRGGARGRRGRRGRRGWVHTGAGGLAA